MMSGGAASQYASSVSNRLNDKRDDHNGSSSWCVSWSSLASDL